MAIQPAKRGPAPVALIAAIENTAMGTPRLLIDKPCFTHLLIDEPYSWGAHISAIVPPTIVDPVEPAAPAMNRNIITA